MMSFLPWKNHNLTGLRQDDDGRKVRENHLNQEIPLLPVDHWQ